MSDSSSSEDINLTPAELVETVNNADLSFLPEKSREKYLKAFDVFNAWRHSKGAKTYSETILLSYFIEMSKTKKSSTLWSIFSMLKATIKTKKDIHIEKYPRLLAFLKNKSKDYKAKKSKIFTTSNIEKFLNDAPDSEFLATKVVLIIGISGACRTNELTFLKIQNIEQHSEKLLVINLPNTKTNIERNFVIRDEYAKIIQKYRALRPDNTPIDRFFLQYRKGKCVRQPMGSTKIGSLPKEIATFLGLQEPEQYTGHCFRRTSATLLADSGADLTTLKCHGGWKSDAVAEGYIEDSIENKCKIYKGIVGGITLNQSCPDPRTYPSTSKQACPDPRTYPSTSKQACPDPRTYPSTSKQACPDPRTYPSTSKVNVVEESHSPTFTTLESNDIDQSSQNFPNHLQSSLQNSTQVTNNSITVPKKNLTFNITNCSNFTFNF